MSDATAHGSRSGTKSTKLTTITKTHVYFVIFVAFVVFVTERGPWAVSARAQAPPPAQPQTQAQQRPVFRGGTRFVRVDAYPAHDGKIVEGLKPEDFEILEDGKPQTIDSLDFIRFDTFTPEAERRNPSSQRDGFELAGDPRYRVFAIFVDMAFTKSKGEPFNDMGRIEAPLAHLIDRVIGVHDLFGLLSSRSDPKDLVLGQKTTVTIEQVRDLWRASHVDYDPTERFDEPACVACADAPAVCRRLKDALKARYHADQTYTQLHALIATLGAIREERKNIVFVSNLLTQWRDDQVMFDKLRPGVPSAGIDNGRPGLGNPRETPVTDYSCAADLNRLPLMDFEKRFQQVLIDARRANVAFYPITPSGLQAAFPGSEDLRALNEENDGLRLLARETGGLAFVDSNGYEAGMRRIADDLQAYYVLGYYTTNTTFDGKVRRITVRTKTNGQTIRARREYRSPTRAEMAALANAASSVPAESGPPAVIGEPQAFRVSRGQIVEKASLLEFVRADRLRVQWPILAALDRREARLLDGAGKPLGVEIPVTEDERAKLATVEFALAPLGRGTYAIELTAGSGGKTERRKLTFVMR